MKRRLVLLIGLTFILAVVLACGDEGSTPTKAATLSPSATATPTASTVPPTPTPPATPEPTPKMKGTPIVTVTPVGTPTASTVPPTPTPPATPEPTPKMKGTPIVTVTPVGTPTPTPSVMREWNVEDIQVNGSTVTVVLHLFAGVDVKARLDGRDADVVREGRAVGAMQYIFMNVTPGPHAIEVRDVVGFTENADVVVLDGSVSTSNDGQAGTASWPDELVRRLKREPVANPPLSVTEYLYKGEKVYFVPQRCCDIFSDLYDAGGNIIAHPDGGITGAGDGRAPDFFDQRSEERIIWRDRRVHDTSKVQVLAPIDSLEVLVMESFPPQYALTVVSGLTNGCVTFGGYRLERGDDVIRIEVVNWKPADGDIVCTDVYGTVETNIPLGSDFEPGRTYTVEVNDVTESFVAQ